MHFLGFAGCDPTPPNPSHPGGAWGSEDGVTAGVTQRLRGQAGPQVNTLDSDPHSPTASLWREETALGRAWWGRQEGPSHTGQAEDRPDDSRGEEGWGQALRPQPPAPASPRLPPLLRPPRALAVEFQGLGLLSCTMGIRRPRPRGRETMQTRAGPQSGTCRGAKPIPTGSVLCGCVSRTFLK